MTLNEYQELALRTSRNELTSKEHLMNGCLGLAGEAGECCDLLKKHQFQDGREIQEKLLDELGDVLWYVATTAEALNVPLETVMQVNIDKLRARYPKRFDAERSQHREEGDT